MQPNEYGVRRKSRPSGIGEEREAREREVKLQMEAMQAHIERLMKVVDSKATSVAKSVGELSGIKLVLLSEDDIEVYP